MIELALLILFGPCLPFTIGIAHLLFCDTEPDYCDDFMAGGLRK